MKRTALTLLLILCVFLSPGTSAHAEITQRVLQSVVRIVCFGRDAQNPNSIWSREISLNSGAHLYLYDWSMGTGFVINRRGYIITNNHVVAPEDDPNSTEHPNFVFVLQKVGSHFSLHAATVIRQDPNADIAIIHCPDLQADPLELLFSLQAESEEVFSAGFPGIADVAVRDNDRDAKIQQELADENGDKILDFFVKRFVQRAGRDPTEDELQVLGKEVKEFIHQQSAERGDFLHALVSHAPDESGHASASPDISDILEQKPLWKGYLEPTVTKGNIERLMETPGYVAGVSASIAVIQHSCNIRHGNSGGPLLNGGGQVVGVVGRGYQEEDAVNLATAIGEAKKLLDASRIEYVTASGWQSPISLSVALIAGTAVAAAVAIAALIFGLAALHRDPQGSLTKLIAGLRQRGVVSELSRPPIPSTSGNWQLVGRASAGKMFQIKLNGSMFDKNAKRLVLGRARELCHLVVDDETVSRQHAQIRLTQSGFTVADRNSSNGTAVNGQFSRRPFEEIPFKVGDTLTLGEVKLDFRQV